MFFLPLQQDFHSKSRHASPLPEFQSDLCLCANGINLGLGLVSGLGIEVFFNIFSSVSQGDVF